MFDLENRTRSGEPAVICASTGRSWSYLQLHEEVALRLRVIADLPRALFFLFARNEVDSLFWYLALLESRHVVALLNADLSVELRSGLVESYRPDFVLGVDPGSGYVGAAGNGLWSAENATPEPLHPDLCVLLPTSGTTGSPKFVRLSRSNLTANSEAIARTLRIEPSDRAVAHLPMHYSYGLSVINSHLQAGASLMLSTASLLQAPFWNAIREHGINSFSGVPYTYMMLRRLRLDQLNVPTLLRFTQAGGKLDDAVIADMHQAITARNGEFWIMYGATEATARMTILDAELLAGKVGSVGKALPGGELRILDESGDALPNGSPGQIEYRGANVMMGYALHRTDLQRGDELRGRLLTGDRGYLDDDGFLYVLGRAKRDAKVFGLRVNLDDIEAMVIDYGPAAAVEGKDRIVVFCEFDAPEQLEAAKTRLSVRLGMSHHGFDFRRIEQLPTLANGKIDYPTLSRLA